MLHHLVSGSDLSIFMAAPLMKYGLSHEAWLSLSLMNFSIWVLSPVPYFLLLPQLPLWALSSLYICPNWGSPKSVHVLDIYQQILSLKEQHTVSFYVISGKKMAFLSTASPFFRGTTASSTSATKFEDCGHSMGLCWAWDPLVINWLTFLEAKFESPPCVRVPQSRGCVCLTSLHPLFPSTLLFPL